MIIAPMAYNLNGTTWASTSSCVLLARHDATVTLERRIIELRVPLTRRLVDDLLASFSAPRVTPDNRWIYQPITTR